MWSLPLRRAVRCVLPVLLTLVTLAAVAVAGSGPAQADPAPPPSVSDTVKQLTAMSRQAEVLTEAWHAAQDQLTARQAQLAKAQTDAVAAQSALTAARTRQERFHERVDELTKAAFQGAQLNPLSALLVSDSPRDYLDQLSALDSVVLDTRQVLDAYSATTADAGRAAAAADTAATRAQRAADDATAVAADVTARQQQAEAQIAVVQQRLAQLTGADRKLFVSPGYVNFPIDVIGSGIAVTALRIALTQQGKPYVWGATGPNTYDCSGLVYWAYKQMGITIPRSSSEQAQVGRPVARQDLQPGDLVFFYRPISHVGIYVMRGLFLQAPQSGDVVKVSSMEGMDFNSARRLP